MIGFGELRRLAAQWQVDIAIAERAYAIDWILYGLFTHARLARALVLRASAALRYAYCADYPTIENPDLWIISALDFSRDLIEALQTAANASGLRLTLVAHERGMVKVEYTGPLGRRSAAQPRITLALVAGQTQMPPARVPLIHRFSDNCVAMVQAIALEEFVAERVAGFARTPRARDVFDLWFALTHAQMDRAQMRAPALFDPNSLAALARVWDAALRDVRDHPTLAQVENDLRAIFSTW
ncbi:MAG: nucleotidyl transferase AbiEii/AbiGii toxin family protein [Chloroflexi bacterium]|nr:nucleotidyl transferase AbiEii/AbiGii toxin family protein [Chloroflexota bacterium]